MASYPYGQGYPGSAGQTPGAPQGGYYSAQQYGGGGYPGYGAPAPGGHYGAPTPGRPYGQPGQAGAAAGGPYVSQAHGGHYGIPASSLYGGQQPGHYGHGASTVPNLSVLFQFSEDRNPGGLSQRELIDSLLDGAVPPGVDPEAFTWFQSVDTDRSGNITFKELKQALVNTNWSTFNDETCIMMINMFDKTGMGQIDVFGFSALWRFIQQWKTLFQQFDRDRSGCISYGEFHQALSQMGYNLSPQFTQLIMSRYCQRSANPTLQLDRFIQICTQLQSITEAYREKDAGRSGTARLSYEDFLTMTATRLI